MPVRILKPTSPGRRRASTLSFAELTKKAPEKSLLEPINRQGGRNNQGKISVRHQGGGHKRRYRLVDFRQDRYDLPAEVLAIEYDPNRSGFIALIQFPDKEKRYILAPEGLKTGAIVVSSRNQAEIKVGNRLPLEKIPTGMMIHNIELSLGHGGAIVRSAGAAAQLMAVEGDNAQIKLPSGEVRLVPKLNQATIGQVSNVDHGNVRLGKAGRMRWLGVRPTVRGKAMNPVDHPHGGGEGLQPIGLKHPKTPWGKPALGVKTRRKKKYSNRLIVKRRK